MLDRAACERRVYRLATLLTGNPIAATRAIRAVVDAQPDLRKLDNAHIDRLTVLRSREIAPSILADPAVDRAFSEALAGLTAQQREAWIFSRVYRMETREIARAMDCSTTASQRHIELAEAAMDEATGGRADAAAETLLRYSMSLDVPEFYRARQKRRRRLRLVFRLAAALLIVIAIVLIVVAAWHLLIHVQ